MDWWRNKFAKEYNKIVWGEWDLDHRNTLNPVVFSKIWNIKWKKILDLGCWNWYFSMLLNKKWAQSVTWIDISKDLILFAKKSSEKLNLDIDFLISNADNLKILWNKRFDIIVCNMAFMDIKNTWKAIWECSKYLIKDGLFVFSISNPIYWISEREYDKEKKYYLKIYKYWKIHSIKNKNYWTTFHHRPIWFYINELLKNWFNIVSYDEVSTPYHQNKIMKDKKLIDYKKEFPSFLIISARKWI